MSVKASKPSPLVTVIIPTFNRAALLLRAIRSVQSQVYTNLEIIIVDDASSDNTAEIVRNLSEDARIIYIRHRTNRGLAAAGRNTGIRKARGEHVAFLDDDDEWVPSKINRQLDVVGKFDMVVCASLIDGVLVERFGREVVTLNDFRRGTRFPPSGMIAKTSVLRDELFDEQLRYGEDWDLLIRVAKKYRIGYVDVPLLIYNDGEHQRITNEARNLTPAELESRMLVFHKHREFLGPFWYRYHKADMFLSYFWERRSKIHQLYNAIRQCGALPVTIVFLNKIRRRFGRYLAVRNRANTQQ